MKMCNKILCFCLIVIQLFILSVPLQTVFADEKQQDVQPSDELLVMQNLGFLPENFEESDEVITRAEGVSYISDALNYFNDDANQVFTDVDAENQYFKSIYNAYVTGLTQGIGDRKFAPDEPLTYEQMQMLAVDALGYKNVARYMTYRRLSSELGLYDSVSIDSGSSVSRKNYVKMLYNMFHAEYAELSKITGDSATFESSGRMLLNRLDIYYVEGILRGKNEFSLSGTQHSDGITIDYQYYDSSKRYDNLHLGAKVRMYYKDVDGTEDVLYVYEYKNEIYEVDSEDIKSVSNTKLEAWSGEKKNKTRSFSISKTADILINNAPMSPFDPELIENSDDVVYLVDNDCDGMIDCVLAWKSETYFVGGVYDSNTTKKIVDKRGKPAADLSKYDTVRVIFGGSEIEFDSITRDTIATVYASDYSATIYISAVKPIAYIEMVNDDEITLNDTVYKKDKQYEENLKNGYSYTPELSVGLSAVFYLDYKNKIVAADVTDYNSMQYGVLIATKSKGGLSPKVQLKIYVPNVGVRIYETKDKIVYNGKRQNAVDAIDQFNNAFDSSEVKSKAIKFLINADGYITKLVNMYSDDDVDKITFNHKYLNATRWRSSPKVFSTETEEKQGIGKTQYGLAANYTMLSVPMTFCSEFNESFDDDEFDTAYMTELVSNGVYTNTEIYDADDAHGAKLVVLRHNISSKYSSQSQFLCVNSIKHMITDDGEECVMVTGVRLGKIQSFYLDDGEEASNILVGDIIYPLFDTSDHIKEFKVVFRFADSSPTGSDVYLGDANLDGTLDTTLTQYSAKHDLIKVVYEGTGTNKLSATRSTFYGNILSISSTGFTATYTDDTDGMAAFYSYPTSIIVCEKTKNGQPQYRIGDFSELVESEPGQVNGSEVFLNLSSQYVTQLVMFSSDL